MSDQARIRVLCVDDHHLLREGLTAIINPLAPQLPHVPPAAWDPLRERPPESAGL